MRYSLISHPFTERTEECIAMTHNAGIIDEAELIRLVKDYNSTLTISDIYALFASLKDIIPKVLAKGYYLNLPLLNTSYSIAGVFNRHTDTFDSNRHKLKLNITKGILLRDIEKSVSLQKCDSPQPNLRIKEVKDATTGEVNTIMTKGGVIEIIGRNIKINGDNPMCGLWFVGENGEETRAAMIIENKPSRIFAEVPKDLAAGVYQVKIVTQHTVGAILKTPRAFVYQKLLTVS